MHAFGLEECGNYAAAESTGRRAVETQPRDSWAQHAVAHVLEMQGRQRDGIAWMRTEPRAWAEESFFAAHNWWHVALYHLDLNEVDAALEIFDGPVFGKQSSIVLDMVDASALLWRLHLRGVPLADRWEKLARNWFAVNSSGSYAFNDFHQMMALVGAGRLAAADELLAAQAAASERDDDNSRFTRDVGLPACRAVRAFADGRYGEVVQLLRPVRSIAHRFGGSHAQRDLIDLTLFEAALRGGEGSLAAALSAERIALKPASPFARLVGERAGLGAPGAAKEGRVKRTG